MALRYYGRRVEAAVIIEDGHWLPRTTAPKLIRVSGHGNHTLKRVAYAAFVGDATPKHLLRSTCGKSTCVNPWHQELVPELSDHAKNSAGLLQSDLMDSDTYAKTEAREVVEFPAGVDSAVVRRVWAMGDAPIVDVCRALGVPRIEVIKIRSGVYDGLVEATPDEQIVVGDPANQPQIDPLDRVPKSLTRMMESARARARARSMKETEEVAGVA